MTDNPAQLVVQQSPKVLPIALMAISALSLAFAFLAEYGFDLEPCILCIYQRVPFAVVIVAAGLALAMPQYRKPLILACGVALLINSGIAFYHVGVEQQWWVAVTGCAGNLAEPGSMTTADFLASIQQKQPKACDQVDWTFLGISMATYNVFYCLGLGALTLKLQTYLPKSSQDHTGEAPA